MVATNSVAARTGNVSAGTSVFAMIVLEKELSKLHPEIDMAGGMRDLNSLLTSRSGFVLTQVVSINSLAIGQNDDSHQTHEKPLRVFILVPTP
jgi:hypothetical protein